MELACRTASPKCPASSGGYMQFLATFLLQRLCTGSLFCYFSCRVIYRLSTFPPDRHGAVIVGQEKPKWAWAVRASAPGCHALKPDSLSSSWRCLSLRICRREKISFAVCELYSDKAVRLSVINANLRQKTDYTFAFLSWQTFPLKIAIYKS